MEKRIASPALINDPAASHLYDDLGIIMDELNDQDSVFYYDFPIFRDESNKLFRSKVILVTHSHGIFIFAPIAEIERDSSSFQIEDRNLFQLDSILYGKCLRSELLRKGKRELFLNINSALSCMNYNHTNGREDELRNEILANKEDLKKFIENEERDPLSEEQWRELLAILEGTKAISLAEERNTSQFSPDSKVQALAKIEQKIAIFDLQQRNAAISIVEGPQRVRGIAGSGKTIVLAMKAAHIHLTQPDHTILLTFWTKSLYDLAKQMISRFYRQFNDIDPNWEKVHILHAWGGQSTPGVYANACKENGIRAKRLMDIIPINNRTKFEQACEELLTISRFEQKYDYILIDEGQDLPSAFYKLCFQICKGNKYDRNIIWAYDDLQTIMDVKPQDVTKTFGVDIDGHPLIDLDRASAEKSKGKLSHDIVLKKSYRNPPEILMCAHALGFGLYSQQPVQILESKSHWEDLGYEVIKGTCKKGQATIITRPTENSPLNLSDYSPRQEIIKIQKYSDLEKELDGLVEEIQGFLEEGLYPHDLLVISLDDRSTKEYFAGLAKRLSKTEIGLNNLQNAGYGVPIFKLENHISASTVYKAKGNEAAVVFIIGVDALSRIIGDRRVRNRLFTAFTRSRAWIRVSGVGSACDQLFSEINQAINNYPNFVFNYPDPEQIETIQRDLSEKTVKLRKMEQMMLDLDLTDEEMKIFIESLPKRKSSK